MTDGPDTEPGQVQPPPVFLERQSYRRRRLLDAARLLPILGAALFAVPLLWPTGAADEAAVPMSSAILYVFGVWSVLILVSVLFGFVARHVRRPDAHGSEAEDGGAN